MYKSPIEIIHKQFRTEIEKDVYKAVQECGIFVDKDELIKVLQYDREQYEKGYRDGLTASNEWISVDERTPELYTSVLVYTYNGYHCVWWRGKDNDWHAENTAYDFKEVTHWMPLPEAPKMKGAKTDA